MIEVGDGGRHADDENHQVGRSQIQQKDVHRIPHVLIPNNGKDD